MKFKFIHVCKVSALFGSVLIHVFFLAHSGFGNSASVISMHEPGLLEVKLVSGTAPVELCAYPDGCGHSQQAEKLVAENDVTENVDRVFPPVADSIAQSIQDRSLDLGTSYYFQRSELSQPPNILTNPHIRLPDDDDPRIIGSAILRLFLSEKGQVDDLIVVEASLPENYVDAIVSGYKEILFAPGELNGKPVKSQLDFEISFTTDQTQLPVLRQNH